MNEEEIKQIGCDSSRHDSDSCPICLAPMVRESYLDKCFHKFCYSCILQWAEVISSKRSSPLSSLKCPLCKTENFSIIHGFDGSSFKRHYINETIGDSFILSKAHKYRLQCYYTEPGILSDIFDVSRYWKRRMYVQPNRWLQNWLRREIQALIQEEDVDIIVHHLLGVINSYLKRIEHKPESSSLEAKQEEFRTLVSNAARPFLMARTERFLDELLLFLASGLNLEAYDAVYMQRLGWNNPRGTTMVAEEEHDVTGGGTSAAPTSVTPEHGVTRGRTSAAPTSVTPYLFIFDEDSDDDAN